MELTLRTEYWDDPKARQAFKDFMIAIFGLDFSEWESCGYWDDAFTPFSYFNGESVVASVCLYLLDTVLDGQTTRLAQISSVGTLPEYRRRGLNRELTDTALLWARGKHEGVFLFSDTDAIPYYRRSGFTPIDEFVEYIGVAPMPGRDGAVKLDPGCPSDRDKIYNYARHRVPVSDRLSVQNANLLMFHALYWLRDHVYEIPELDCLVFYKRESGRLSILDIVGERVPQLEELYPYISDDRDTEIEFHFCADKLDLQNVRTRPMADSHPFVKGTFPVSRPVFPYTSKA